MPESESESGPETPSLIAVSPTHRIQLAETLRYMVDSPPDHDYVIRRVSQKTINGQPLIQGELILSGTETLEKYPLAKDYPVHFRKTYYPICFHQDPAREFENHLAASEVIDIPAPIGSTRTSFRSCFIPGRPLPVHSPFGSEPEDSNIPLGRATKPAVHIGLWHLLESIHEQVQALHEAGIAHGDLFLHNVIVSTHPIGANLIDFELARRQDNEEPEAWEELVFADFRELLREALYIQCALGRQRGLLAEHCLKEISRLVTDPGRFERALDEADATEHWHI